MKNYKNMVILGSFSVLFMISANLYGTEVSDTLYTDTHWTLSGSPYVVTGDVFLVGGKTLTIDPGVQVKFKKGIKLEIGGTLLAQGTSSDSIVFTPDTSAPSPGDWQGIRLASTSDYSQCKIEYCRIEYAYNGIHLDNNMEPNPASISNNTIEYCQWSCIYVNDSKPEISNNILNNFGYYGIYVYGASSIFTIQGNSILQDGYGYYRTGYGIYIYSTSTSDVPDVTIAGNKISMCKSGIKLKTVAHNDKLPKATIYNNEIYDNEDYNLELDLCYNSTTTVIEAGDNWWGTTNSVEIASKILDNSDSESRAIAYFLPFLDGPGGSPVSGNYIQGRFDSDTTLSLSTPYIAVGNIYVGFPATMTINPGVEMRFATNDFLKVEGTLLAQGTSSDSIVFTPDTSAPSPGDWQGIRLASTSDYSQCKIEYCRIEYAYNGIHLDNNMEPNPASISNNTIEYCQWSCIYVNDSKPEISNNTLRNFGYYGIYTLSSSGFTIQGNTIIQDGYGYYETGRGVYIKIKTEGNATLRDNTIISCSHGIEAYKDNGGNYPFMLAISGNVIRANSNFGIYLHNYNSSFSTIQASIHNNDILDNDSYLLYMGACSNPSTVIDATNNWWGTVDTDAIAAAIYDNDDNSSCPIVDYIPFADSSQGQYCPADFNHSSRVDGFDLAILGVAFGSETGDSNYNLATDMNSSGRVDGFDLAIFGIYFGHYGSKGMGYDIAEWLSDTVTINLLPNISTISPGDEFAIEFVVSDAHLVYGIASNIKYNSDAVELLNIEEGTFLNDDGEKTVFMKSVEAENGKGIIGIIRVSEEIPGIDGNGRLFRLNFKAKESANRIFDKNGIRISLIAPDGKTTYPVKITGTEIGIKKPSPKKMFVSNFSPNPLTSNTCVRYGMPNSRLVRIHVYDISGRQVRKLQDKIRPAGYYFISWNGLNEQKQMVSSGVYFIRVEIGKTRYLRKVMVIR